MNNKFNDEKYINKQMKQTHKKLKKALIKANYNQQDSLVQKLSSEYDNLLNKLMKLELESGENLDKGK